MVFNFLGCTGMQCLISDSANSHSNVIMCRLFLKYNSNDLTYYVFHEHVSLILNLLNYLILSVMRIMMQK